MGHALNYGLTTNAKGATWDTFRLTFDGSGNATLAEDCGAGLVTSVAHTGTGVYTVQLAKPYPPKMIQVDAQLSAATAATAILVARYQTASYNATTGQFIINVSTSAPAAADPQSGSEMHVDFVTRRYTANP